MSGTNATALLRRFVAALWIATYAMCPETRAADSDIQGFSNLDLLQMEPAAERAAKAAQTLPSLEEKLKKQAVELGPNHIDVASTLIHQGALLTLLDRHLDARRSLERALAIQQANLRDDGTVASTKFLLGTVLRNLGETSAAVEMLLGSLAFYDKTLGPRSVRVGQILVKLGRTHFNAGDLTDARRQGDRALSVLQSASPVDDAALMSALNLRGDIASGLRQFEDARGLHERALAISRTNFGRLNRLVPQTLDGLANALSGLGQHREAARNLEVALAMKRRAFGPETSTAVTTLQNLAIALQASGEYAQARGRALEALVIVEAPPHLGTVIEARSLGTLGNFFASLNDWTKAKQLYERALTIHEGLLGPDHVLVAMPLVNLARTLRRAEERDEALRLNRRALSILESQAGENDWRVGLVLNNIGFVHLNQGQVGDSRNNFERALGIYQRTLGPTDILTKTTLTNLAIAVGRLGDRETAKRYLQAGLYVIASRGSKAAESWQTLDSYSRALRREGDRDAAIYFGKQAVNAIQVIRSQVGGLEETLQQSFFVDKAGVYRHLSGLLVEEGRLSLALEVLQMLKKEEYFDFIQRDAGKDPRTSRLLLTETEQRIDRAIQSQSVRAVQAVRELDQLSQRIQQGQRLSTDEQARRKVLQDQLLVARNHFQAFLAELPKTLRTPAKELRAVNEGQLDGLRQLLRQRPGTAIVHYVMGPERLSIILTLPGINLPFQRAVSDVALHKRIVEFRQALMARKDFTVVAQGLFDDLIRPIEKELTEARIDTLLLSLDGALRYVPFAALHDGNGYLVERFAVGLLTEATKVRAGSNSPATALRVGGLGVTKGSAKFNMKPLPAVREELFQIVSEGPRKGLMPGVTFIDEAFTESRLQELVDRDYPILHVASHFQFQPGNERDSFLLLGNEGKLTLEQIRRMDLTLDRVDLLTLSACETAVSEGRNAQGVEIEGLGVLMLNQGARNVMATLWQVADQSTAQLMFEFYRRRAESPEQSKVQTLRAAQIAMMRGTISQPVGGRRTAYAEPYFWAPFVVMGSGQ